jgi:hypothetical protein
MNDTGKRRRHFRFSIGTLFLSITILAGFLGLMRLKYQMLDSDRVMQSLRNGIAFIPLSNETLLAVSQFVSFGVSAIAIFIYRKPEILWLHVLASVVWFVALLISVQFETIHANAVISSTILAIIFFEPTFAAVVAIVAWCLVLVGRKYRQLLALTVLLSLSLFSEVLAHLALDRFRAAIGAALAVSGR